MNENFKPAEPSGTLSQEQGNRTASHSPRRMVSLNGLIRSLGCGLKSVAPLIRDGTIEPDALVQVGKKAVFAFDIGRIESIREVVVDRAMRVNEQRVAKIRAWNVQRSTARATQ